MGTHAECGLTSFSGTNSWVFEQVAFLTACHGLGFEDKVS